MSITKELETVYITSSGVKYLKELDALCAESQIQKIRGNVMTTGELLTVFEEKRWGVYYRAEPLQTLTVQNGSALYKINEVDEEEVIRVLRNHLEQAENTTTG